MKTNKKQFTCRTLFCLLLTLLLCTFVSPHATDHVEAKVVKKTIKEANKAYRVYLIKQLTGNSSQKFALKDLNDDALPELIIENNSSDGTYQTIYSYVGQKVKKLITGGKDGYFTYKSANNAIVYMNVSDSGTQRIVYKWGGKKLRLEKSFSQKISNYVSTYTINGKSVKATDYYKEYEKYSGVQTLSFESVSIESVNAAFSPGLTNNKYTLFVGESGNITLQTTTSNITWKSSNSSVVKINPSYSASVKNYCNFTAKKAGTATLTATADGKKYRCKVTVKKAADNIISLYEEKIYSYDLNNDGTPETISWKAEESESSDFTITMMINEEVVLTRTEYGYSANVQLVDIDSKDNLKELRIQITEDSDCTACDTYYQYDGSVLTAYADFKPVSARAYAEAIPGNGTITYREDTPLNVSSLKCYYVNSVYKVENGTFIRQNPGKYTITTAWSNSPYTACKKLSVKKKLGGSKKAYTLNIGDVFYMKEIQQKGKKTYIKITSSEGKNGWLKIPNKVFFAESYYWG